MLNSHTLSRRMFRAILPSARKLTISSKKMELEAKKRSLEKLTSSGNIDGNEDEFLEGTKEDCVDCEVVEEDQSCWMKLVGKKPSITAKDLATCTKGEEFACVHNCNSYDFMN